MHRNVKFRLNWSLVETVIVSMHLKGLIITFYGWFCTKRVESSQITSVNRILSKLVESFRFEKIVDQIHLWDVISITIFAILYNLLEIKIQPAGSWRVNRMDSNSFDIKPNYHICFDFHNLLGWTSRVRPDSTGFSWCKISLKDTLIYARFNTSLQSAISILFKGIGIFITTLCFMNSI